MAAAGLLGAECWKDGPEIKSALGFQHLQVQSPAHMITAQNHLSLRLLEIQHPLLVSLDTCVCTLVHTHKQKSFLIFLKKL